MDLQFGSNFLGAMRWNAVTNCVYEVAGKCFPGISLTSMLLQLFIQEL